MPEPEASASEIVLDNDHAITALSTSQETTTGSTGKPGVSTSANLLDDHHARVALSTTKETTSAVEPEASTHEYLLDDDGALTTQFEAVLRLVFLRYASPTPSPSSSASTFTPSASSATPPCSDDVDVFDNSRSLSRKDFEKFTQETNGQPLTEETWSEILEFFEVVEEGSETNPVAPEDKRLTFKGLIQLYQLQTENDPDETRNDLKSWGYDENLQLVGSRREVPDEGVRPGLEELTGFGLGGEKKSDKAAAQAP